MQKENNIMASVQTLNADTLEGQLLEIIERVSVVQNTPARNPNAANLITSYTRDNLSGIINVSITLVTFDTLDATTGGIKVEADPVFID